MDLLPDVIDFPIDSTRMRIYCHPIHFHVGLLELVPIILLAKMNRALFPILALCCLLSACATQRPTVMPKPSAFRGIDGVFDSLSPRLTALLAGNPAAGKTLRSAFAECFPGRNVQLYHFYSSATNRARAYHFYRGENCVAIAIRESEDPWDDYFGILYETLNSLNEKSFAKLAWNAEQGRISRAQFPVEALRIEHRTVKQTRDMIRGMEISEGDVAGSVLYRRFQDSPDDFDEFLAYVTEPGNGRNPVLEYQQQYDQNVRR